MKVVWRSLALSKCGRVQMGQLGTFWTVTQLSFIDYCLWNINYWLIYIFWSVHWWLISGRWVTIYLVSHWLHALGKIFRNCLQRTNSLQKHPSPCSWYLYWFFFWFLIFHWWMKVFKYLNIARLDKANMYWKTCFWWSISGHWHSY